ncbi:MAG: sce7726 family protein [Lachnospiraceae bacterium]|nr:sce7726 family protein [Lachnospiraceae bacterium]
MADSVLYDKDIREPLCFYLEELFGKCRIFEEKRMGDSRADMVMVLPCALCGIEIKSDADSYARLSRQVKDYSAFFDFNYVVVGSTHVHHIKEHVPEEWGIITVDNVEGQPDFYFLRQASPNPGMRRELKLSMLWRPELAHIQELNGLHKYPGKSKDFVRKYIIDSVQGVLLDKQISDELFERDYDTIAEKINTYRAEHGQKKHRRKRKRYRKVKALN